MARRPSPICMLVLLAALLLLAELAALVLLGADRRGGGGEGGYPPPAPPAPEAARPDRAGARRAIYPKLDRNRSKIDPTVYMLALRRRAGQLSREEFEKGRQEWIARIAEGQAQGRRYCSPSSRRSCCSAPSSRPPSRCTAVEVHAVEARPVEAPHPRRFLPRARRGSTALDAVFADTPRDARPPSPICMLVLLAALVLLAELAALVLRSTPSFPTYLGGPAPRR